jgi:hypothetical protein
MTTYFDVWKKKMINNGGNEIQSRINTSKDFFNRNFANDPSYKLARLKKRDIAIEETDLDTRIVNIDTDTKKKKLYLRPDTNVEVGDYIKYPNKTYLVLEVEDNLISPYAESKQCNKNIKWMYKGALYQVEGILTNANKYTLGDSVLQVGITEGNSRYSFIVSCNKETDSIPDGQRVIFNKKAWKVTQTDIVSDVGLNNILFDQTAINTEIDDVDNEIAGAWENKHTYTWNLPTSTIEISKDNDYTLNYSIVDETGKDIDYSLVTVKSSDNTLINITRNGKDIVIKGLNIGIGTIILDLPVGETVEEKTINFEVKETVTNQVSYKYSFSQPITQLKTYVTTTLNTSKYINGVVDSTLHIDYSFDANAQILISSGKIVVTRKSDSSISIKNVSVNTITNIYLTVTDSFDNTKILDNQQITLTGM